MGHGQCLGQMKVNLKVGIVIKTTLSQVFDSLGELDGDEEFEGCQVQQERDARSEPLMRLTPIGH